ncbi:MAG: DUF6879 family protein, partial [Chloroflexota bacterium]
FGTWPVHDFWLFDEAIGVRMRYDESGRFLFAERLTDPAEVAAYRRARDVAMAHAIPLVRYLAEARNS